MDVVGWGEGGWACVGAPETLQVCQAYQSNHSYWPLQKIMPIGRNVSCLSQHLGHVEVRVFAMPPGLPFIAIGLILLAVGLVATYLESTGGK